MRRIGLQPHTSYFFRVLGIVSFLSFGCSALHAVTLPVVDSVASDGIVSEEPAGYEDHWSLWLQEGNVQTFILKLEEIVQCVESEKVDIEHLPANASDMSPCQWQVWDAISFRDSDGHNLLQVYLKNSKPDNPGDALSFLIIKEAVDVINALLKIGMTMMDWDNPRSDFDNLLFLAIQYDKFGLLNQLLAAMKEFDSVKYQKLAKLRSSKGVSLANAIQKKKADEPFALYLITNFELVKAAEELEIKTGVVYTGVEVHLKGKKGEL